MSLSYTLRTVRQVCVVSFSSSRENQGTDCSVGSKLSGFQLGEDVFLSRFVDNVLIVMFNNRFLNTRTLCTLKYRYFMLLTIFLSNLDENIFCITCTFWEKLT